MFTRGDDDVFLVSPGAMYPLYLEHLAEVGIKTSPPTQFALEQARLCFTEDLFQVFGAPLHVRILKDDRFKLRNFPPGVGPLQFDPGIYKSLKGTPSRRLKLV